MIDVGKIKKIISKNYYATGAIIGFLVGILPFIQPFTFGLIEIILFIPRQIMYSMSDYFSFEQSIIITPILTILIYILLGLFIAFLFRKMKSSKK